MVIRASSIGGIPFGNNAGRPASPSLGQPYFNGEAQRLELYTNNGWQNIVSETPSVTNYTGSVIETNSTNTLTITGTNFAAGATVSLIGTDTTEYIATSVTVNNATSITAVFGAISASKEPYDIKVTNPSNLYGIYYDTVIVNDKPIWQTPAGSLGTFADQSAISIQLSATDEENNTLTYSISSGALPSGVTLSSSGLISGTLPDVSSDTTYNFTINVSDESNTAQSRAFSLIINAAPVWQTASGSLGSYLSGTSVTLSALSATDSGTVTYSLASGSSLPGTLSLNSSTGIISGTMPTVATATTYNFTINASDSINTVPRSFSILAAVPVSVDYLVVAGGGGAASSHAAGGGGGGGFRYGSSYSLTPGTAYTVTVSAGGAGGSGTASNGTNSTFATISSTGGGLGSDPGIRPGNGGSGGGGRYDSDPAGGTGNAGGYSPSEGNNGGSGYPTAGNGQGGGGGGAGAVGGNASSGSPGTGGSGAASSITGTSTYYAGGGGGAGEQGQSRSGGTGGGGNAIGGNGSANTGGGGGAGRDATPGGNGGSGVVIIAYPDTYPALTTISAGLTYDQPARSGYRVYRFTAGTGTVTP